MSLKPKAKSLKSPAIVLAGQREIGAVTLDFRLQTLD
jgi:hypothetical protein